METIRNYNATSRLFLGYGSSFVIGILAIFGQVFAPDFSQQGLDLIDSFFIYAVTSQFTHLGWTHLGLNMTGLALIAWGFNQQRGAVEWAWIQVISFLWIAFYLTAFEPLSWYCGLSGALHFQFVSCLLLALKRNKGNFRKLWPLWIMVAGLLAKLYLEIDSSHSTDELVGGPIAFQAHRGGALGGLLMGYLLLLINHFYGYTRRA